MDFFNSLAQVVKNNKNFKIWEDKQADQKAQREELYSRRQYTQAEIETARQLGDRIIDVVDIMDNHSESVAENVETAVAPIVGIAPLATTIPAGVYYYKKILKPGAEKMSEIERTKIYENEKAINLAREIDEDIHKTRPNKYFSAWHLTSKKKIDKIANPDLKKRALEIYQDYKNATKPISKKLKLGGWSLLGIYIGTFIGATIYAAKLQVDSSKIARFQARKILEDPKAFVNYTPEQIAAAKKYIEEHPELKKQKKKEKLKTGLFSSIVNLFRDKKAYKEAKLHDVDDAKKISRELTSEEIKQAKRDQEVIQRAVRIINNEAEKNSQNMEVAAGIILGATPIVGGAVGWLTGVLMNKTGYSDKLVNGIVEKTGSKEAQEAYKKFKELKTGAPGYTVRWGKFADKLLDSDEAKNVAEAVENAGKKTKNAKGGVNKFMTKLKQFFAIGMAHHWGNSKMIGLVGAFLSAIPAALIALKLQKSAARAGRYTAKRDLEKDPRNFIGYTDEDFEEVKDVKGKKQTYGQKVKEYALFVPNVIKQYWAYNKYKRNEFKEHQLLMDELQKSEVSDAQMKDAKNLQRKLFNTFEKVDDNSQTYSESMEAAIEILQPFAMTAGVLTMLSPVIYTLVQVGRGKMTAASVVEKITAKLAKASNFLQGKTFKKYLDDVAKNVPHKVENTPVDIRPLAHFIKDLDLSKDTVGESALKLIKNCSSISEEVRKMNGWQFERFVNRLKSSIDSAMLTIDEKSPESLTKLLEHMKRLGSNEFADVVDIVSLNQKSLGLMSQSQFKSAMTNFFDTTFDLMGEDNVQDFAKVLPEFVEAYPELEPLFNKVVMNYGDVQVFSIKRFKQSLVASIDKGSFIEIANIVNESLKSLFSSSLFKFKLSELCDLVKASKASTIEKNQNVSRLLAELSDKDSQRLSDIASNRAVSSIAGLRDGFGIEKALKSLKERFSKMTDAEFTNFMDEHHFSSMDKKTMLEKIIPNLETIMKNIPKNDLAKIKTALVEEFKKNPDEFVNALASGKLFQIFVTKSLINTAAWTAATWTALNIAFMWIVQSWLADIQLKAGRLGVMKALESLEDPAYYANIEPVNQPKAKAVNAPKPAESPYMTKNGEGSNLLKKFSK